MNKIKLLAIVVLLSFIPALVFGGDLKNDGPINNKIFTVGVNQYVQHPILDEVLAGIEGELDSTKEIKLIIKNSNANSATCMQINEQFVMRKVDAIVALGTPSAQSAVEVAGNIPVIFSAITDPVGSKLADSIENPGGNKTGTTNRWPFEQQVELVAKLFPKANVGVLVNPSEANCEAGMGIIRKEASSHGLKLVEVSISTSADVLAAAESLKGRCEVIMISPSNVLFSGIDSLFMAAENMNTPVLGGDESAVSKGSAATYAFSNRDVGKMTAVLVKKVLSRSGKESVGSIGVMGPPESSLLVNDSVSKVFKLYDKLLSLKTVK